MYASIRRYKTNPASVGEVIGRASEGFVPIIRKAPGLIAYYIMHAGDGVVASISVFEDDAGAKESDKAAAGWVKKNLAPLLPNPPEITAGEVMTFVKAVS